jgi:hypothetical protein
MAYRRIYIGYAENDMADERLANLPAEPQVDLSLSAGNVNIIRSHFYKGYFSPISEKTCKFFSIHGFGHKIQMAFLLPQGI